jgi:XXXCH domain-containing protein
MQFKQMKQEMEEYFHQIKSAADQGEHPEMAVVQQFVRLTSLFQSQAAEEWAEEADDFMHLATQLLQCVKKDQIQDIPPLIDSLEDSMNYCHRTLRS